MSHEAKKHVTSSQNKELVNKIRVKDKEDRATVEQVILITYIIR